MTPHNNPSMVSPLIAAGPTYLDHGPVVAIEHGGKRPAPGQGWKGEAALKSAADLTQFIGRSHNVAMRLDNFLVIDVDGEEGRQSLAQLENTIGSLPRDVTQMSGGGGLHIFFRLGTAQASELATKLSQYPKIDFKAGEGHILVMAPSVHPSGGQYKLNSPLADAPPPPRALLDLLRRRSAAAKSQNSMSSGRSGERHTLLLQHGVRLANQGWDDRAIREALWQYAATFHEPWTDDEAQSEIDGVAGWLENLSQGRLFPLSATPVDIAAWLRPRLLGELVHLDNGDWLAKRENVFDFVRREQIKATLVRKLQPALADFESWLTCLDGEDNQKMARRKLERLKSLHWTDKAIEALAADPDLCVRVCDLDPPGVLNFTNGAYSLDGLPAPQAICTKQLGVAFDPSAQACPVFDGFLGWALSSESGSTLLDVVGQALNRERSSQYLWICEGAEGAGKSTFFDTIAELLGSYAVAPDTGLLFDKTMRGGGANEDLFALRGAAWAAFAEGPEGCSLSAARCKTLTGGDKLSARQLYGHLVKFENRAEILLMTNHETRMNVDDGGLRRRVKRVVFKNQVTPQERDDNLSRKIMGERSAIMNRLLFHARRVREDGIGISNEIEQDTQSLFTRQDIMEQFTEERLIFSPDARSTGKAVYESYQTWCSTNGLPSHSSSKFYSNLERRGLGCEAYTLNGAKAYRGVRPR